MSDATRPSEKGLPWQRWQTSLINEGFAQARRWARLPALYERAQRVRKGVTPSEVVHRDGRVQLLRYQSAQPARFSTPLIFVFALVNRPYILDLREGRSVVSHFVRAGFDTYLVDWGRPGPAERHQTLDDHVNGYLARIVDHVRRRTESERVNLLGYCMGGTMSAIYTALHPDRVRNLILLAAGIDFSNRDSLLNLWTQPEYFDVDQFVDAYGNCPPEFLQSSFLLLKPVQNLLEKPVNFFENLENDRFLDDFLTMETWLNDNIPVPGEVFRAFVKHLYQSNQLAKNELCVGGRRVDLRRITCPILNIMAQNDDLVPCAQSQPFNDLVGSADRRSLIAPAGHIGLAVGSKAQQEIWPEACAWLAQRSDRLPAAAGTRR